MEDSGAAAADDQGSGWFEVKKKHRSSSKLSIQNWVGGLTRQQVNGKGRSPSVKSYFRISRPEKDVIQKGVLSHNPSSKEHKDEYCLDKRIVDDVDRHPETPPLKIITTTGSQGINKNVSEKKSGIAHRIKWGDLEEGALASDCGTAAVSEIRFGEIGDEDLAMCGSSRNACDLSPCNSSKDYHVVNKDVVEVKKDVVEVPDASSDKCHSVPSVSNIEPREENGKEVNEATDIGIISTISKVIDAKCVGSDQDELENIVENPHEDFVHACEPSNDVFTEEPANLVESPVPILTPDVDDISFLDIKEDDDGDANETIIAQGTEPASSVHSLPESSGNRDVVSIHADCSSALPTRSSVDNLSNTPITSTIKEPEEGESKERFRERLWCFLFENLNRAIDELYLLCELECDLGQVKEAILVLQEAESDFQELNIRVKEFETTKNSCLSASGSVMSMKGDHRRPHALSWEVRRMTTSPHRAEILSSSLEAFKKIQEERERKRVAGEDGKSSSHHLPTIVELSGSTVRDTSESETKSRRKSGVSDAARLNISRERRSTEAGKLSKSSVQNSRNAVVTSSDPSNTKHPPKGSSTASLGGKSNISGDKEKEKDKRHSQHWKPNDAWKEKRNWEEILAPQRRLSTRVSHSPSVTRRSAERARILHDKLMSPEKKKKTAVDLKKEAEEKHARAMRIRNELENERVQKLQHRSEKLNRVSEWQAVRSMKLREGMHARHQRSESRHEAYIAQVVKRAGDESIKVNEVRFITSLNEENKKFLLDQKLRDSEMRRAEKFQVMKTKQKEDMAREEAVVERRRLIEAEKLQRLAETQRRKEEALLR
ncbi:unnamed protein product, partial [Amaranthus hypochondriacus]